jgi:thiosulfate dehydrogenase [quinone] large subunit
MSDDVKKCDCSDWGNSLAFLVLRGWIGIRAVVTGLEKYSGMTIQDQAWTDKAGKPDASGAMLEGGAPHKFYALSNYHAVPKSLEAKFDGEPLLPHFLTAPFYTILGPLLILTGLATLLGIGTRISLFAQGVIYIMLTVGLILINQNDGVAWLGIHVGLIALALSLAKHNRLAVCKNW